MFQKKPPTIANSTLIVSVLLYYSNTGIKVSCSTLFTLLFHFTIFQCHHQRTTIEYSIDVMFMY